MIQVDDGRVSNSTRYRIVWDEKRAIMGADVEGCRNVLLGSLYELDRW